MSTATFINKSAMDSGLEHIKNSCDSIVLVDYDYTLGDSYATVRGFGDTNVVIEVAPASAVISDNGDGRALTVTGGLGTAAFTSSGTANYLKVALLDTVNESVLAVFHVTNQQVVTIGTNRVIAPEGGLVIYENQP